MGDLGRRSQVALENDMVVGAGLGLVKGLVISKGRKARLLNTAVALRMWQPTDEEVEVNKPITACQEQEGLGHSGPEQ